MTDIQVKYWQNQETAQHNRAQEELGRQDLAEKHRSNLVNEELGRAQARAALISAEAKVKSAEASVRSAEAQLRNAQTNAERARYQNALDLAKADEARAQSELASAKSAYTASQTRISNVEAQVREDNAKAESDLKVMEYLERGGLSDYIGAITNGLGKAATAIAGLA